MTRSQEAAADVAALLRARNPLLWIVTGEEARVERYLVEAASSASFAPVVWDVAQGARTFDDKPIVSTAPLQDPGDALGRIMFCATNAGGDKARQMWIMRDLPPWLSGPGGVTTLRQLRNLARKLPTVERERAQAIVILSPINDVPPELKNHATVIEWPLPDREEIASILDAAILGLPENMRGTAAPNGTRDAAIDAAVGLSGEEAQSCYARSLVQLRRIDPATVSKEKKRVIAREKVLEWFDPLPGGLDAVGGLEALKEWLVARKAAYTPAARAYGLPAPKGALLVGVPGCGKSLTAKAIATAWSVPLLRLDLGALKGKFVGDSEGKIRKAFEVIEAIGRCVVWIDEIEKAMQGATSGSSDGGVSSDQLGALLSWMQERRGESFVIATANGADSLPPELLRKGRFDEMFFIDLPTRAERISIADAALRSHGRKFDVTDLAQIAMHTDRFTGAEIAALIPDALFTAFADGERQIVATDVIEARKRMTPLADTAKAKIEALRAWAEGKCRKASGPEPKDVEKALDRAYAREVREVELS